MNTIPCQINRLTGRFLILTLFMTTISLEGQNTTSYQLPHKDILELADVTPAPFIRMNTKATLGLLLYRSNFKTIDELSDKELRLGGLRINPRTNISSRTRYYIKISLFDIVNKSESIIHGLPEHLKATNLTWSHDQTKVAFANINNQDITLWLIDLKTSRARLLSSKRLNANLGSLITWQKDDLSLIVKVLPQNRKDIIDRSLSIPTGPTISENSGQKAQNRTYQDLLKNPTDEANFKTLALSELWEIGVDGTQSLWKSAAMYSGVSMSPDGKFIKLSTIEIPFSYIVPYYRFPQKISIFSASGHLMKIFHEMPLVEEMPKGFMSVREGPRRIAWRSDHPSTLFWVEALDKGDPAVKVSFRDAVYQQKVPFESEKEHLVKTKERFQGIIWGDSETAVIYERWWNTRNLRTLFFNPSVPDDDPRLFMERNFQDRYSDPGFFVTEKNEFGRQVLQQINNSVYLLGDGFSKSGKIPFVDKLEIKTFRKQRVWEAKDDGMLEDISAAIDLKKGKILVRRESKNDYPNYFFRNINDDTIDQITKFENPFETISNVYKEVITYKRDDGLELTATMYLPVGYDKESQERMPMLMWAYPREYKDKNTASQTTSYDNEFIYPYSGSPLYWVNRGYVVLEDVAFPIVGEGEDEPNDTFIQQLVSNAKAAIDAVDRLGYIDRKRVGIGGHSYGAFMTANLLSHSNLFAAGIARSGAYNRTLTPFGFQSEERNYWETPEVYYNMSPFMHADKMKTPLLLIHGEEDNNSGTYPMQSERYFNALKGLGATVKLVMLPKESHGYVARESILHMLYEQDQWLDKYVKNKQDQINQ